ncbi:YadA family autotransporter adhesin [Burkholderia ubonensis]|uniref:YadA family autotransporter adhesin n=1 Tax=Burkholderia ubonensis TaxID=101571 RepID=UPI001E41BF5E|nr:YadA C-terminal domain-containing protein [Burkholderia ubonensis]
MVSATRTHYYSVNDNGKPQGNHDNDGATGVNALAAGTNATAAGAAGVAVGNAANAGGNDAIAIGDLASAAAPNTVALGAGATASNPGAIALGSGSVTASPNPTPNAVIGGVTYSFAGANPASVVSIGSPGAERQLTNVAAGRVTPTSTDAINGSQLNATNRAVDSLSGSTSTGISSLSTALSTTNSNVTSLSTGLSTTNSNVASLSTGLSTTNSNVASLSTGLNSLSTSISSVTSTAGSVSTIASSLSTGLITAESNVASLSSVVSAGQVHYYSVNDNGTHQANYGNDGAAGINAVAIGPNATAGGQDGVALGNGANAAADGGTAIGSHSLASGINDVAVGPNAIAAAPNSIALGAGSVATEPNTVSIGTPGNERRITNVGPGINPTDAVNVSQLRALQSDVSSVARRAYSGVAAATALAMIPDVDEHKTIAVGIGGASYQGYGAVALGFTARLTTNVKIRAGASGNSAGYSFGVGVSYQW